MIHPQAERAAALWALDPSPGQPGFEVEARRERGRQAAAHDARESVEAVLDVDADGVPCRLYRPRAGAPLLLALHGGGWVFGEIETHDAHWRRVANQTGWAVMAVDYRHAPEHQYPAASDDVDTALAFARSGAHHLAIDGSLVGVAGDSAGGQLALVTALRNPGLAAAVLVYPCIDRSGAQPSYRTLTGGLTATEMDWYWRAYTGTGRAEAELDPLNADLSGLPPTLVLTAEHDPLRDEGELLAERIAGAGVSVTATRHLGMIHGFWRWPELFDAADVAVGQVAGFLNGVIAQPPIAAS